LREIARWKLKQDSLDGGNLHHGENHGVVFMPDGYAQFDGRGAYVSVSSIPRECFDSPFTISAWVHTRKDLDDVLGDIVSKYDGSVRRGLNFCIQNFHGVTSSQSNYRNLFFGIDDGSSPAPWRDHGRPGNAVMIWSLCVWNGDLYASTFESGKTESGRVYRYTEDKWVDCGSPYPSNSMSALAVYEGKLYAAASHYRSRGSSLPESENELPGGRVYCYEGGTNWRFCGKLGDIEAIMGLAVYKGKLFASSMYAPAGLFCYEGGEKWVDCGNPGGRIEALTVYDGSLFGSGYDLNFSGVYRYNGDKNWTDCGTPKDTTQTYSFAVHRGELYVGTWPTGTVFRREGEDKWTDVGRLGTETEVMALSMYNGKLYAGTLPLAQVWRYEGQQTWSLTEQLDKTPDVKYRRAWSMAVFAGRLFCGTLPSGHVFSMEAGRCVTHDKVLEDGWRHVAAVRDTNAINVFVDGVQVATQELGAHAATSIANDKPFLIGFGEHDYFCGGMRDVRIFEGAATGNELAAIAKA
jgi:hypothetical protein